MMMIAWCCPVPCLTLLFSGEGQNQPEAAETADFRDNSSLIKATGLP
jgi:hypothetical protein